MNYPEIQHHISLKPYNTFGIDTEASSFVSVKSSDELSAVFSIEDYRNNHLVLGGGSNVLFTDYFKGIVIKNEILGIEVVHEDADEVLVKVGAGENWHQFVIHCINNGYGGIENLSLIPGTVGAAPMQNIGAYGVEIKDVFHELEAYEIESGEILTFDNAKCSFAYRSSIFKTSAKGKFVIINVTLRLNKNPLLNTSYGAIRNTLEEMGIVDPSIKDVSDAVIKIRTSKLPDPAVIGNAGSFFKNPVITQSQFKDLQNQHSNMPHYPVGEGYVKVPAGWLIEKAGWKGKRVGETGSHKDQALVLVNYGNASGNEIKQLSEDIQVDIQEKFGISLQREVNII